MDSDNFPTGNCMAPQLSGTILTYKLVPTTTEREKVMEEDTLSPISIQRYGMLPLKACMMRRCMERDAYFWPVGTFSRENFIRDS